MPRIVADEVARMLRQRILSGEWADGSRIPAERDLSQQFGVARNTVRRAMALLEEDGTLNRRGGSGTFVASTRPDALVAVAQRMMGASPADIMELRLLVEPTAAALAATNASASELQALEEAHQRAVAAVDMPEFEDWDAEFHHRVFAGARNQLLKELHELLRILRNQSPWFEMKKRSFSEERRQRYCQEHAVVVEALLRRDPTRARQGMQAHLETVSHNLLARWSLSNAAE
ncbi:FadR/GntR family transcriptional regulator [Aurantimonas sp. VKM B-3413]|uniref:FadR/GntR family transcriptional regulator n=1 Tax=Aurantimonas sp. VKM B-3413 TaxID=2779401 RepID=UPI001E388B62|nr:FCD domain-containing protein [Aurantimonas sp. VKM B-3413]MCB8839805.1 FCD domain-containing protein [Aurantimonas sp. VKM B-3413]